MGTQRPNWQMYKSSLSEVKGRVISGSVKSGNREELGPGPESREAAELSRWRVFGKVTGWLRHLSAQEQGDRHICY